MSAAQHAAQDPAERDRRSEPGDDVARHDREEHENNGEHGCDFDVQGPRSGTK